MRLRAVLFLFVIPAGNLLFDAVAPAQQPFTLQQALSAPIASELTAAPVGKLFAWVENAEGRRNLWVGGPDVPARMLTSYTEDDGQEIRQLAWSPDAKAIAYTYGAESGADGKPANPAHLQRPTPVVVSIALVDGDGPGFTLGEGRSPLFSKDGRDVFYVREGKIWVEHVPYPAPAAPCRMTSPVCDLPLEDRHFSGPAQMVFDRGSASELRLSPDGKTLAFLSRRTEATEPSHTFLALFAMRTKTLNFPAPGTGDDLSPVWSPDGKEIAWLRAPFTVTPEFALDRVSANPWSIQVMDLPTGRVRQVFAPKANKPGSVLPHMATGEPPLFFGTGHTLIFASEADGWVHLYSVDASKPEAPVLLTPGLGEVDEPVMGSDGGLLWSSNIPHCEVAGYTTGNAGMGGHLMCDGLAADHRLLWAGGAEALTTDFGIETQPAIAADGSVAALAADAQMPMHAVVVGRDGAMTPLRKDLLPNGYPAGAFVTPQQVIFLAQDGMRLHGQVFMAERAKAPAGLSTAAQPRASGRDENAVAGVNHKHAAVIFLHGGPRRQMLLGYPEGGYYSNAYAMNQYLASRGFIVLSVNYRCGIGYGLDFRQCAGGGPTGAKEYADVLAAVAYLRSRGDVDMKHVGLWGGSYGGYLTALGLARNSDLFAAGVDFHGVHNWNWEDNAGDWLRGSFAERDAIAAKALANSPMGSIGKWRSPVLLIHGDDDPEVAYAQTPRLAEALQAHGVHVEELIFPDEVHGFLLHKDWVKAYEATAAFFEKELQPGR